MSATPPILDDHLCFSLYGAAMAVNRAYKPLLDQLGLTYPQYLVLAALWEEDGLSIGAIADRLALESSTVTPLVKRLEGAGFVDRRRNAANERQVLVTLTPAGRAMQGRTACLGERLIEAAGLDPERFAVLNADIRRLRDAVAATLPPG